MEFGAILEAMQDPRTRHAAIVHLPIALSVFGVLLAVVAAIWGRRARSLRWITFAAYALLILLSLLAVNSGEGAEEIAGNLSAAASDTLHEHEEMAERVWIFALIVAALGLGASLVKGPRSALLSWFAVAAALFVAGWLGTTAHHGGDLVYGHGVGAPKPERRIVEHPDERVAFFINEVRPLLEDSCMGCHNPSRPDRVGGLDQTSIAGMLTGGDSGPAIVPGRPDESLLIEAVRWELDDLHMPPQDDPMPADDIAILERWVAEGAVWDDPVIASDETAPVD